MYIYIYIYTYIHTYACIHIYTFSVSFFLTHRVSNHVSCVNVPSQFAGVAALDGPDDSINLMLQNRQPFIYGDGDILGKSVQISRPGNISLINCRWHDMTALSGVLDVYITGNHPQTQLEIQDCIFSESPTPCSK